MLHCGDSRRVKILKKVILKHKKHFKLLLLREIMAIKFFRGKPKSLEKSLKDYSTKLITPYNPEYKTNISKAEIRRDVVGYTQVGGVSGLYKGERVEVPPLEYIYVFFPKTKGRIDFSLAESGLIFVALRPEDYGFEDQKVKVHPSRLKLNLSSEGEEAYDRILRSNKVNLASLLDSVGFMINHSMEYDIREAVLTVGPMGLDGYERSEFEEKARKEMESWGYIPHGSEVMKGICSTAGNLIRRVLFSLGINQELGITHVGTRIGNFSHDTTLAFSKRTGRWMVINSKSLRLSQNLVAREELGNFGSAYAISNP